MLCLSGPERKATLRGSWIGARRYFLSQSRAKAPIREGKPGIRTEGGKRAQLDGFVRGAGKIAALLHGRWKGPLAHSEAS